MKRKKRIILALNLLLGGFVVSTLSGCEGEVSPFYTLELNFDSTLGSVTSETPQGAVGDTVTVKITPNEGIVIDSVKVNGEEVDVDDTGVLTFTAIGGKNTVDVAFKDPTAQPPLDASFSVKAEFDSQMGTVTLDKTAGADYSASTSAVKVTITPNSGYFIQSITVNGESRDPSITEFAFQPKQGENIVKVTFAKKEGPVDEKPTYKFKVSYNEEGGTVIGDKTAGEISEGLKVKFTVTPKEGYLVESVTFNGTALEVSSSGIYEVTPVEGENTFNVVFKLKEVEPPLDTFTISVNVVNQEGGTYTLSKTEGTTGETVTLHVEPASGYNVQVTFNGELIVLDENFDATLKPKNGVNQLDIIFAEPANGLESLEDGFDINFDETSILGTPDFDKTYFGENFFYRLYDVFSPDDTYKEKNTAEFYDMFISKLNVTKETLKHLNDVIDETDAINRLKEAMSLSQSGIDEKKFYNYFSLIVDVKSKVTIDEFSYLSLFFMFGMTNGFSSGSYWIDFGGLYPDDFDEAIAYFESKGDSKTANEIKTFNESLSRSDLNSDEAFAEGEKTSLLLARFLYPMVDSLLEIESDKEKLSSLVYQSIMLYPGLTSGTGMDQIFAPENKDQNIEVLQFLGKVLYRAMPNIDSFRKLVEKLDIVNELIKFLDTSREFLTDYSATVSYDKLFEDVKKDSDSLYYVLKFIGRSLENITESEYQALVELINAMSNGSEDNSQVYSSAIKISKLFVKTLFEFGNAQTLLTEKFATGFSLIGKIIAAGSNFSVSRMVTPEEPSTGDTIIKDKIAQYSISIIKGDNAFGNFDFNKIPEFIATVAQYQADNLGETEINYINSFFNDINEGMQSFYTNENRETYFVEYVENPGLNEDLSIKVTEPSSGSTNKYTISDSDTSSRVRNKFTIEFEGIGKASFAYIVGCASQYGDNFGRFEIRLNDNSYSPDLFIRNDYKFNENDGLYYYGYGEEYVEKSLFKFKDNLDISTLGWNYRKVEIEGEGRYYFFKYYVYKEEEVSYEYSVSSREIIQNQDTEITYVDYKKVIKDGETIYGVASGRYELETPVKLDTSNVGYSTVSVNLKDGTTIEVSYYVNEYLYEETYFTCNHYAPAFECQGLTLNDDMEFHFIINKRIVYVDESGGKSELTLRIWDGLLTPKDFKNKLDNSEAGLHTDSVEIDGETYVFTYNVKALLESSDMEYQYYIDEPYLIGGEFNGILAKDFVPVVKARRLFYEDEYGGVISCIDYAEEETKYFSLEQNDLSNIPVEEDGSTRDVEITLVDGTQIKAKLYFSNYYINTSYSSNIDDIVIDNLPSDDYVISLSEYTEVWYNTWRESNTGNGFETSYVEATFGEIKDYLDLKSSGWKNSNIEIDGHVYNVEYNVLDTLEMGFGEYQEFNSEDKSSFALHISNTNNQEVIIKTRDLDLSHIEYLNENLHYDRHDEGEYRYYIFNSNDFNELWLRVNTWQASYLEIIDPSQVKVTFDEMSIKYNGELYFESDSYKIGFVYFKSLEVDGFKVYSGVGYAYATYTVKELKELYAQSGNADVLYLEVEINGQTYSVQVESNIFPGLSA